MYIYINIAYHLEIVSELQRYFSLQKIKTAINVGVIKSIFNI